MSEPLKKQTLSEHWFWGSLFKNKGTYVQIALASIFINLFGLASAFYIMTVYDRVMPNSAYNTLIALTIGMAVVILFDFSNLQIFYSHSKLMSFLINILPSIVRKVHQEILEGQKNINIHHIITLSWNKNVLMHIIFQIDGSNL